MQSSVKALPAVSEQVTRFVFRFLVDHKYLPTLNFVHYLPLFIGVDVFVGKL